MALPTASDVHVDSALTNISVAYIQDANNFVYNKVFPMVPVVHKTDKFMEFDIDDMRRIEAKARAAGTESRGKGIRLSQTAYSCEVYAVHHDIPDQVRANQDPSLNLELAATTLVTQDLMLQAEKKFCDTFMTTTVWGTDKAFTAAQRWDNKASSDPFADIKTGQLTVLESTGIEANTLVLSVEVFAALKEHPLIVDRLKYTSSESITADILARLFEVDRLLVTKASQVTSAEAIDPVTTDFICGKHALLCHVAPTPGLLTPTAGYTFVWSGFTNENNMGVKVKNFRMEHLEVSRVEGQFSYDQQLVGGDLGYFFNGAVA